MSGKGRKPKPAEIHLLRGNPSKKDLSKAPPKSDQNIGEPPAHLTAQQKRDWRLIVKNAPRGVLTAADKAPLLAWVVAYDTHREAMRGIQREGLLTVGSTGSPVRHPYVAIQDKQAEIMIRASAELGFTPSARSRVAAAAASEPRANKFANNGI